MRLQFVNNLKSQNQYEKIVLEILEINMGYETYQRYQQHDNANLHAQVQFYVNLLVFTMSLIQNDLS